MSHDMKTLGMTSNRPYLLRAMYDNWPFFRSTAGNRIIGEIFREPDASLLFGVSRGTFYSVFLIIAGVLLIVRAMKRDRNAAA